MNSNTYIVAGQRSYSSDFDGHITPSAQHMEGEGTSSRNTDDNSGDDNSTHIDIQSSKGRKRIDSLHIVMAIAALGTLSPEASSLPDKALPAKQQRLYL